MNSKEIRGLMEAYAEVYAPQEELDEASRADDTTRANIARYAGKKGISFEPGPNWDPSANRGRGAHLNPKQKEKQRRKALRQEELDIFDVVLEFLQAEGYVETLEEAEWMMANMIDEEAIDIILGEAKVDAGLSPLQKIRKRNKAYSIPGEPAGQQTSNRRAERSSTRSQKKERGAKSAFGTMRNVGGPYKEEYVGEAQEARNNPEKYEADQKKKSASVRGEKTPMPPRGDKRREDFEKWYAKQMGR